MPSPSSSSSSPPQQKQNNEIQAMGLNDVVVPFLSSCYLPLFYLRKTKHWSLLHFKGFFLVLTRFVVTVYVYCTFYFFFLFTSISFFFSSSISLFSFSFFLFCCCCSYFFGIVESKRQKGTEVGLAYISWFSGTETAKSKKKKQKKKKRAKGSFLLVSSLDFHVAAMSQHPHWHQVQKRCVCWRFCKYVQMWKYKLPRMKKQKKKCTYSSHKRIPSRPGDKNDSVFININIYWVWQPSDCYMHFLGKLEDLYGSSFSTL